MKNIQLNYNNFDLTISHIDFVFRKKCTTDYQFKTEFRKSYGFVYIVSGGGLYDYGYKQVRVEKNDVVFLKNGEKYTLYGNNDEPWEAVVVSFMPTKIADIEFLPFETANHCVHTKRFEDFFNNLESIWNNASPGYKLAAKATLSNLIYELLQEKINDILGSNSIYAGVKAVADYMDKNYKQKITVLQLADISGYSTSHFSKLFSEIYKVSPIQYLNEVRINHAKALIKSGNLTLSEIAEQCGFSNIYYFSRMFKQMTGCTPKKY